MDYYPVTRDKKVPTTADHQNGRPTPSTDSSSSDDDDFELAWRPRAYYFCNKCLVTLDLPDKNNSSADETDGNNSSLEANRGDDDDNKLPSAPNKRPPTSIDNDIDRPLTVERDNEPQQSSADSATKYLVKRETVASKRRPEKKKQQSTTTDAKQ